MGETFGFTCTLEDIKPLQKHTKYNYSSSSPYLIMKPLWKNVTYVTWKWVTCSLASFQTPMISGKNPTIFESYKLPKLSYFLIKSSKN